MRFTPPSLPQARIQSFLEDVYGVSGKLARLDGERDQNFSVSAEDGKKYVVKISSADEAWTRIDLQIQVLDHIEKADPHLRVPRQVRSRDGALSTTIEAADGKAHAARLLSYIPGASLNSFDPPSRAIVRKLGSMLGRLCRVLQSFDHPGASEFMAWDIMNGLLESDAMRNDYLPAALSGICAPVLDRLKAETLPRMRSFQTQVIHNDAHAGNVIYEAQNPGEISGFIDFGDVVRRPLVVDLSTALASLVERDPDITGVACTLVDGFEEWLKVPGEQISTLFDATLARLILSAQLMNFRITNDLCESDTLRDVELPRVIHGLNEMVSVDPMEFEAALRDRS